MPRYLLAVTYQDGGDMPPMTEWEPSEIKAHLELLRGPAPGVGRQW